MIKDEAVLRLIVERASPQPNDTVSMSPAVLAMWFAPSHRMYAK